MPVAVNDRGRAECRQHLEIDTNAEPEFNSSSGIATTQFYRPPVSSL